MFRVIYSFIVINHSDDVSRTKRMNNTKRLSKMNISQLPKIKLRLTNLNLSINLSLFVKLEQIISFDQLFIKTKHSKKSLQIYRKFN